MKRIKFLALGALLAISSGAYAQFTNTTMSSSSSSSNSDGWNTVWVEYNPIKMKYDVSGAKDQSMTGFSAGFSKAFSLSQGMPVFLEAGIGLQYAKYSASKSNSNNDDDSGYYGTRGYGDYDEDDYEDYEDGYGSSFGDITLWSVKVPVNLLYNYVIPNSNISLAPFVGATLRYNVSGTIKAGNKDVDLFDKKDMGEVCWERLQFGWQIGVKARFGQNYMAGISYGNDFSEITKKAKFQTISIALGYTF